MSTSIWVCLKIVYPYTQWFCWSLSLWKMAISSGILTQHFQTNPYLQHIPIKSHHPRPGSRVLRTSDGSASESFCTRPWGRLWRVWRAGGVTWPEGLTMEKNQGTNGATRLGQSYYILHLSNIWFNIFVSNRKILIHFRLGAKDSSYLYGMGSKESYCDLRPSHGDSGRDLGSYGYPYAIYLINGEHWGASRSSPTTLWITNNNNDFFWWWHTTPPWLMDWALVGEKWGGEWPC